MAQKLKKAYNHPLGRVSMITLLLVGVLLGAVYLFGIADKDPVHAQTTEAWYLRNGTGAACGPGTQRDLSQTIGSSAATQSITSEQTWNRTESARTIEAGTWEVVYRVTTGSGSGPPNKVTVVVERMNSSCVSQETILSIESGNLTAGATETITATQTGVSAITFNSGDILVVRFVRSSGGRTQTLRFNGADPDNSRVIHPIEAVAAPGTPGTPTYTNVSTSTLTANWTSSTDADYYKLERAPDSGGSPGSFAEIATTTQLTYNDSGLTSNTTYWYRVRATNAAGDGNYSGNSSVTTDQAPPGTPGTPTYTIVDWKIRTAKLTQVSDKSVVS